MKKLSVYQMSVCGIMAALMCILGPMSVPIGVVPVSFTNLVVYVAVILLGTKLSAVSYVLYLLLGLVGLPVFSGFQGGLAKLAGPTGGYLIGFILMAILCGIFYEKSNGQNIITGIGMIVGTLVAYAFGTAWFVIAMDCEISYALTVCVYPFIPFDLIKIVIAIVLGKTVKNALVKAGLAA